MLVYAALYVIARTNNGRPSLMHVMSLEEEDHTQCGLDITQWSRAYSPQSIPQILCKKCSKKV